MTAHVHEGGCLCGAVRYRVSGPLGDVVHCHCLMCQRSSGAPIVTWAVLRRADVAFTGVSPSIHRSSATGTRRFCPRCGCQIAFEDSRRPADIDITAATLDAANQLAPSRHIWVESRRPWIRTCDGLPEYPEEATDA
jgi:hypothetical protein